MKTLLAFLLLASAAQAQTVWQMNAAMQNQYNSAMQSAAPYYYAPAYRPAYVAPRYYARPLYRSPPALRSFERAAYATDRWSAEQDQLREMRQMNRTLQSIEWDLQDAAWGR